MFSETRVICIHLGLLLFLPFINWKKDKEIIKSWFCCSCILFIFPFLPNDLKDNLILM